MLLQYHTVTTLPEQQCGISLCSATSSTSKAYIKEMAELCKNIKEPKALCNNHISATERKKSSMFHNSFFQMEVAVWDHTIKHEMISHSTCPPSWIPEDETKDHMTLEFDVNGLDLFRWLILTFKWLGDFISK